MRRWIALVEQWDKQFRVYNDTDVDVFRNPSRTEFASMLHQSRGKMLRGLIDVNNNLYVWDGFLVTHGDIDQAYRKTEDYPGFHSVYLLLYADRCVFNDINYDANENDDYETYPYDWYLAAAVRAAHACPALVHLYGANFVPIGHDSDTDKQVAMTSEWIAQNCRARQAD